MVWKGSFPRFSARSGDRRGSLIGLMRPRPSLELVDIHMGPSPTARCSNAAWDTTSFYDQHDTGLSVFRERPGRLQWMGIIFAGIGVLILLMGYGAVPWASLNVALSAALFAFFRKRAPRSEPLPVCSWAAVFRAVPVGLPDLAGRKGEGHFLAGRRIHGSLCSSGAGFVSAIPQLGLSLGIPRRADDLAGHHASHFADYGFSCSAHSSCANPYIGETKGCWCSCSSGWVLGASCPVPSFSTGRKKLRQVAVGNRAGEVLRNEGGIEP